MNQTLIQEKAEDKILAKARFIAQNKRIMRYKNNLWCVQSGNDKTPDKFYCVTFDEQLDCFICDCKDFEIRGATRPCCHILSAALFEGGVHS